MLKKGTLITLICIAVIAASFIFQQEKKSTYAKRMDEVTFTGVQLNCQDCQTHVETALQNIIGINKYKLNPSNNTLTISYDHNIMEPSWIEKSLQASGIKIKERR